MMLIVKCFRCTTVIRQPIADELDWADFLRVPFTHHVIILRKVKVLEDRIFYIHECAARAWNKYALRDFIKGMWSEGLSLAAMTLEDIVVARILFPECAQHHEHLVGDGHVAVLAPLALEDEQLLAVKADVVPSETACLADPEGAVIDECKQGLVVQGTVAQKKKRKK